MALVYDTTSTSNSAGVAVTSLTYLHTMAVGSGGILVVAASYVGPSTVINSVTYGAVALTKIDASTANIGIGQGRGVDLWYLLSPPTGANNVVITANGASGPLTGGSTSFTGSSGIGTSSKNSSTSAITLSTTTNSTSSDIVVAGACSRSTTTTSIGGSQTQRYNVLQGSNIQSWGTTQTGGTGVTSAFSFASGADNFAIIAVPVLAAVAGTAPSITGVTSITGINSITL